MSKQDTIQAVIFDHDDTLVGTIGPKWDQHKFVAKKYYGKDLTEAEIRQHWGKPLHELICLLYDTDDAEQAMAYNIEHHESFPKMLFAQTIPTLKALKQSGKKVGIITATSRFSFEHDLDLHRIPRELLDFTQTSEDTDFHKPDYRVFEPLIKWLDEQGIAPSQVVYVGDGLHDMQAAVDAGFLFLGVQSGLVSAAEFDAAGASSVPDIAAVSEWFETH